MWDMDAAALRSAGQALASQGTVVIEQVDPRRYVDASSIPFVVLPAPALHAGGARLGEVLIHQGADLFLNVLGAIFRSLTPADIWVGVSMFQTLFDAQDAHNHVRFLYRDRLPVAGMLRKPSVLATEGLTDSLVPNHASESMAWSMA
jgi:hypothetical protein